MDKENISYLGGRFMMYSKKASKPKSIIKMAETIKNYGFSNGKRIPSFEFQYGKNGFMTRSEFYKAYNEAKTRKSKYY